MTAPTRHATAPVFLAPFAPLAVLCALPLAARAQCPADFTLTYPTSPTSFPSLTPGVMTSMVRFDPDGPGPQAPMTIGAFYAKFNNCLGINTEISRLDRWDVPSNSWVPLTQVFDGMVHCMTTFDDDGTNPNPPRLYIGGRFGGMGPEPWAVVNSPNLIKFDGEFFDFANSGLNGEVHCMLVHDDDGPGPVLPRLYVGGNFSAAPATAWQGEVNAQRLIRLTGTNSIGTTLRWENPGGAFDDRVFALASFDEDGPGAGVPRLAVGGAFSNNGGDNNQRLVALYNGSVWSPLAQGLDTMINAFGSGRRVFALAEFDEDGNGPNLPSLFAGGSIYQTAQGLASPLLVRWKRDHVTGVPSWIAVDPAPGLAFQSGSDACTNFCSNIPTEGTRPRVMCLTPFDLDGAGPAPGELYIGGDIEGTGGIGLMKWNAAQGSHWVVGASGRDFHLAPSTVDAGPIPVYPTMATAMITVPGNASVPPALMIAGGAMDTRTCGGGVWYWNTFFRPTFFTTTWSLGGSGPAVTNQPDNTWTTLPGSTSAGFALSLSGTAPFTYQWRKDGVDLVNGAGQGLGGIIGATGPAVILGGTANPVNLNAQGWYDCRISNACGTGFSRSAWLVVQPDAAPYYPVRFDSPVPPVTGVIGNTDAQSLLLTGYPRFFVSLDGTPFAIAPTGNNTWHARSAPGGATASKTVTIPVWRPGVGEVYTLINTQGTGATSVRLSFSASGGASYTTTLVGGTHVRSHSAFQGPQETTSPLTTPVFASGITRLDKQRVPLPNVFRERTLTSISITDLGTDATARAFVAGLTLRVRPPVCGPSDIAGTGAEESGDGVLDNNDFVVFIDWFFSGDLRADVGSAGGVPGADGVLDNNDFVVFIDRFFVGC